MAARFPNPPFVDAFLRQYWRIIPDPDEREFIRTPELQINTFFDDPRNFGGDCDDAATLGAALLAAAGWPASFVAYRKAGDPEFSHVNLHSGGLEIDPVVPASMLPIRNFAEVMEVAI